MPTRPLLVILVTLVMLAFIADGYRPSQRAARASGDKDRRSASPGSRWMLGGYFIALALVFDPGVKAKLPSSLPHIVALGFLPMFLLLVLMEAGPFKWRLFRRRHRSALSNSEKRQLRRERKMQRLRRTQARRDGK